MVVKKVQSEMVQVLNDNSMDNWGDDHYCSAVDIDFDKKQKMSKKLHNIDDAYRSRYPSINAININQAWDLAAEIDRGLPKSRKDMSELDRNRYYKRALITLARALEEMRREWS